MSKDDDKKPGKIDFSKFRISVDNVDLPTSKKVILHVPVGKPGKQKYVRVNPNSDNKLVCATLKLEDEERKYLVSPHIVQAIIQDVKSVILSLAIDRQGNVFLWEVPPTPLEGRENTWNQSQRQIAEMAENKWVRLKSNMSSGSYDAQVAEGEIPEPIWPTLSCDEILNIAFPPTHIIDSFDHPVLRKLRGAD